MYCKIEYQHYGMLNFILKLFFVGLAFICVDHLWTQTFSQRPEKSCCQEVTKEVWKVTRSWQRCVHAVFLHTCWTEPGSGSSAASHELAAG